MCRYAEYGPYKNHFACFDCRKVFRRAAEEGATASPERVIVCPDCRGPMRDMGLDFKAPPRSDVKQWQKVALLYRAGFTYHSCGCCGPGFRPSKLADVDAFVEENTPISEAERVLKQFEQRRG